MREKKGSLDFKLMKPGNKNHVWFICKKDIGNLNCTVSVVCCRLTVCGISLNTTIKRKKKKEFWISLSLFIALDTKLQNR